MSVSAALNLGAKTLQAYQTALQVVGNNISNADTDGYSRQKAVLTATRADQMACGSVGTGVEVSGVERVRDAYLDIKMEKESATLGYWEQCADTLSQLELYLDEPSGSTGLSTAMDDFWAAWEDLSNAPDDDVNRASLVQQSLVFTDLVNATASKLSQLQSSTDDGVKSAVSEVNSICAQIGVLNGQIVSYEAGGAVANDLRDQRDLLATQLGSLTNFVLIEQDDGAYGISIGGKTLVWGSQATELATTIGENGFSSVVWSDTGKEVAINNGEIAGLVYARDTIIPAYEDKLDALASAMIREVNSTYSQGYCLSGFSGVSATNAVTDAGAALSSAGSGLAFSSSITAGKVNVTVLDGDGNSTVTAIDITAATTLTSLAQAIDAITGVTASVEDGVLTVSADDDYTFQLTDDADSPSGVLMALGINTFFSGTGAEDITVNGVLQDDSSKIAAGLTADSGDNGNALAVAALKDALAMEEGATTFDSYYASKIIGSLGVESAEASSMVESETLIVDKISDSIDETSGVSLDEEMAVLVQYQHAYAAAAKYIGIVDAMLETMEEIL